MLWAGVEFHPQYNFSALDTLDFPGGFEWDQGRLLVQVTDIGGGFVSNLIPRDLVNPAN